VRPTRFRPSVCRPYPHTPKDPDVVYVPALGDAFGANEERGVFRSRAGGKTWSKVLYRDADLGAVDLSMARLPAPLGKLLPSAENEQSENQHFNYG
jgi:hypothetical protein